MKKSWYHDMFKFEMREFMSMSRCKTLDDMIAWACKREIDLETVRNRKLVQAEVSEGSGKKPKVFDS